MSEFNTAPVRPRLRSGVSRLPVDTRSLVPGAQVPALMRRGSGEVEADAVEKWTVTNDGVA